MTLMQLKYAVTVAGETSLNEASKKLYISQPSLTAAIHALEDEIGISLFVRSKTGIKLTAEGAEFIGYARQVLDQYALLDAKYISKMAPRKRFSVSMQHYTFAVDAFIKIVNRFGMDEYEFEVHETKTHEVIENVKTFRSEVGVLYLNGFNRAVLEKIFKQNELVFTPLMNCSVYAYMAKTNPLASCAEVSMETLADYPCLAFDQGEQSSFYLAEEVLSTYNYKRLIRANDRATLLNLMKGVNGYTLCSGIICENLNGSDFCAVPLSGNETMQIGYISRSGVALSALAKAYIAELETYRPL